MNWNPIPAIIFMFASVITLIIVVTVISPLITAEPITDRGFHLLEKILMSIMGMITGFVVGTKTKK